MAETKNTNKVTQSGNSTANGDIAGRDINNYTGQLESFIIQYLEQKLVPMLNEEAINIKDSIGIQIREIIDQQVLNPLKRDLEMENINHHLSVLKEELKNREIILQNEVSKQEIVDRTEIVNEWIEGMEKIPKEEEELSRIWEGWYIDFYEGKDTPDLQFILNKMKDLSSKEAIALLKLNQRTPQNHISNEQTKINRINHRRHIFYLFYRPMRMEEQKVQYTYDQLLKKELIEKDTSYNRLIPISLITSIMMLFFVYFIYYDISYRFFEQSWLEMPNSMTIILICSIIISWSPYFIKRLTSRKYRRTWIGDEIVSYANKIKDKSDMDNMK